MTEPGIEARTGAKWWADKIREGFALDAGAQPEDAITSAFTGYLTDLLRARDAKILTPDVIDAYEAALAREIQRMLDNGDSRYFTALDLGCDYGPGPAHSKAFEEVGVKPSSSVLPYKTTMWVSAGRVTVGDGYKAGPVDLPLSDAGSTPPADRDVSGAGR